MEHMFSNHNVTSENKVSQSVFIKIVKTQKK